MEDGKGKKLEEYRLNYLEGTMAYVPAVGLYYVKKAMLMY